MGRIAAPEMLAVTLTPAKGTACSQEFPHRFAHMGRVKEDRSHSPLHMVPHPVGDLIADRLLCQMGPPDKNICIRQYFFCQTMLRHFQCRDMTHFHILAFAHQSFQCIVNGTSLMSCRNFIRSLAHQTDTLFPPALLERKCSFI